MTTTPDIAVDVRERGLVLVTINRPRKHNALTRSLLGTLATAVRTAGEDPLTRCVVLRGAGDKYFAAGGDLVDLAQVRTADATRAMAREATSALDAVRECSLPVVAFVNGDALGGGAELAVACDLRMLAAHAKIGYVHGRLAITPAWGGGTDLCQLVGGARALRMMSRSEMVSAQSALAWGLVDAVVEGGIDGADARAFLEPLLATPSSVLRGMKAQVRAWRTGEPRAAQRAVEARNLISTWLGEEHWAAVDRFLGKAKPGAP